MLPTVRPRFPHFEFIRDKFGHALYTGNVTNGGEFVQRFERKLAEYLGVSVLCFNNGQTALIAMLLAAGLEPDDLVAMPSFTFCGTAAAVTMLGGVPLYCEIDPHTLTLSAENVDEQLDYPWEGRSVKFILGVDVYGICCDYPALQKIADKYQAKLLFDSAPAFGSFHNAFPTGRYGDAQIFSFHATKPFSTMEGGCLCTKNPEIYERAKAIRDFGQDEHKECIAVGLNGKMMEVCAIVGLENLKDWSKHRHLRTLKSAVYRHRLHDIKGVTVIHEPGNGWPIWTYMPVLIEPEFGVDRDSVLAELHKRHVMARKYYAPPVHLMKPYENGQKLPITEAIASKVIALPMYGDMLDEEMNKVAFALAEIGHGGRRPLRYGGMAAST